MLQQYVNEFNFLMRNIMLLDFLQSSLQMAALGVQILVVSIRRPRCIFEFSFMKYFRQKFIESIFQKKLQYS
ncbi:hypothetical protein NQ314_004528 [Rhamnusium bicolor]|uniref:Uncharacterized protein n=1 Tax=Rhamnusium bicolor TaxID=1586634 RepID=A0AAV8ZME9_9CUCU|nr:hypothetical protein NQ314_004528 [Rhamnusium bicolor]